MNKKVILALTSSILLASTAAICQGVFVYNTNRKQGNDHQIQQVGHLLMISSSENKEDIANLLNELEVEYSASKSNKIQELINEFEEGVLKEYYQKQLTYLKLNYEANLLLKQAKDAFEQFEVAEQEVQKLNREYIKAIREIEDINEFIFDLESGISRKEIKYDNLEYQMDNGDYIHKRDLIVDLIGSGFKAYSSYKTIDLSNVEGAKSFRKLSQFVDKDLFKNNYLIQFSLNEEVRRIFGPKLIKLEAEDKIGVLKSKTAIKVNKIIKKYNKDNKLSEVVVEILPPDLLVSFNNKYQTIDQLSNIKEEKKADYYELSYSSDFINVNNAEIADKKEAIASYINDNMWFDFFVQLPKADLKEIVDYKQLPYGFKFRIKVVLE